MQTPGTNFHLSFLQSQKQKIVFSLSSFFFFYCIHCRSKPALIWQQHRDLIRLTGGLYSTSCVYPANTYIYVESNFKMVNEWINYYSLIYIINSYSACLYFFYLLSYNTVRKMTRWLIKPRFAWLYSLAKMTQQYLSPKSLSLIGSWEAGGSKRKQFWLSPGEHCLVGNQRCGSSCN